MKKDLRNKNSDRETEKNLKCINFNVILLDRSVLADKYVFAKYLLNTGKINGLQFEKYKNFYDSSMKKCPINFQEPNIYIYIECEITKTMERINFRNRYGEVKSYNKLYLEDLKKSYKYLTNKIDNEFSNTRFIKLDNNKDYY
jgi:deoxyadenosine/deoxycytidine kinase